MFHSHYTGRMHEVGHNEDNRVEVVFETLCFVDEDGEIDACGQHAWKLFRTVLG